MTLTTVYRITNTLNGKKYIGITNNLTKRINAHKQAKGGCKRLHAAIKKYGFAVFLIEIIGKYETRQEAIKIESEYITKEETVGQKGYNTIIKEHLGFLGKTHSQKYINRLKNERTGKGNSFYGKQHTKRHKERLSKMFSGDNNPNSSTWHYTNTDTGQEMVIKNLKKFCEEQIMVYRCVLRSYHQNRAYRNIHRFTKILGS